MSDNLSETRVQQWVDEFAQDDRELFNKVGENFQYYLDHVDELETGEFDYEDTPHLNSSDKLLIHSGIMFGIDWGKASATLYAVYDEQGKFDCLYAHGDNAAQYLSERIGEPDADIEDLINKFYVQTVTPQVDARESLETFLNSDVEMSNKIGECLLFLLENEESIDGGSKSPDDFPHFSQNVKWLLAYSALFGRLWEYSYPGLWVVLDEEDVLVHVFGSPTDANEVASQLEGSNVERVNVQDGDIPNDIVLGSESEESQ